MSLAIKRRDCPYETSDNGIDWHKCQLVKVSDLDQLEAALLNAQCTVQAFRKLLAYSERQLSTESQIRCKELAELCRVERERDNAQAQLTAMTAERDALTKGINDTIDELQSGKISSIPGVPRTEWGVGCDAGKDAAIQILIRRTK